MQGRSRSSRACRVVPSHRASGLKSARRGAAGALAWSRPRAGRREAGQVIKACPTERSGLAPTRGDMNQSGCGHSQVPTSEDIPPSRCVGQHAENGKRAGLQDGVPTWRCKSKVAKQPNWREGHPALPQAGV